LNHFVAFAWIVAGTVVGLLIVMIVFAFWNRRRLESKPGFSQLVREQIQGNLLDEIERVSIGRRMPVLITHSFWRSQAPEGSRISWVQRAQITKSLILTGDLVAIPPKYTNDFTEIVCAWLAWAFAYPARRVRLSDRTWELMAQQGLSGWQIVVAGGGNMTMNNMHAGRDIIGSTNSGRDTENQNSGSFMSRSFNHSTEVELGRRAVAAVVAALREESLDLADATLREKALDLADKLDTESNAAESDEDVISGGMNRAKRYVISAGGLMSATHAAVQAWQKLRGDY